MASQSDPVHNPIADLALTRRSFLRGASSTFAATLAAIPLMTEPKLAVGGGLADEEGGRAQASGRVLLNANENPLGPCAEALEAIAGLGARAGRYDFPASVDLARMIMVQEGLKEGYLALYPGASDPLYYAMLAFTAPGAQPGLRESDV